MNDISYVYRQVGGALVDEILLLVERGESVVLLGPQGGGKRLALRCLAERLETEELPYLWVHFRDDVTISTEADLLSLLKNRVHHSRCEAVMKALVEASNLADWFQRLGCPVGKQPIPFSFAGIDWLATALKEKFLAHIRDAVEKRYIVAVLTCESLLANTLAKETSPFQCGYQFVITSHDRDSSRAFFMKRVRACELRFVDRADPEWNEGKAFEVVHEAVGGNVGLMRAILWGLSERRLRFTDKLENHPGFTRRDVDLRLADYSYVPLFGLRPFARSLSLLEQEPNYLRRIEKLVDGIHALRQQGIDTQEANLRSTIEVLGAHPEPLELTSFLERDQTGRQLRFASRYVATFATLHLTWERRGDLHAKQGCWNKAFDCYERIEKKEDRWRPVNIYDFPNLRSIVNRLCREFSENMTGAEATRTLREILEKAGTLLFGLKAAKVLHLDDNRVWVFDGDKGHRVNELSSRVNEIVKRGSMTQEPGATEHDYQFSLDESERTLVVLVRLGRPELSPPHALFFESDPEGPKLDMFRRRLLVAVATNFLTCYNEARLRRRMWGSRFRLGDAMRRLFAQESTLASVAALGEYLHSEFRATGVRLFLIDVPTGNLKSAKSWGFKDPEHQRYFDAGHLVLTKGKDPELWTALKQKGPVAYRWHPKGHDIPPPNTDLGFIEIQDNSYAELVERSPGDYWIDFPLFVGDHEYGKLTLAFTSHSAPPGSHMDDLRIIAEILSSHLQHLKLYEARVATMRSAQQQAVASAAHDLANRLTTLPKLLRDCRQFEPHVNDKARDEFHKFNERLAERIKGMLEIFERAKKHLAEVRLTYARFDLAAVARDALLSVDGDSHSTNIIIENGDSDETLLIEADKSHLSSVLHELVSDSNTMHPGGRPLKVEIRLSRDSEGNWTTIDYTDNGPGVPDNLKTKILEYLFTYRPGQRKQGLGLGLGYVNEAIQMHKGTIQEIGKFGQGVHFKIKLPSKLIAV
jgi:signal transduction histidine kinase/energy-coupling factor transporter ATP-binding protein EcfA2